MNLFSCTHLYKQYRSGAFTLSDISLELRTGEITGVVGENGNGKTTLLRIIAGDLAHDSGELNYFGNNAIEVLTWDHIQSRIAYIPQRIPQWYGILKTNLIFQASILGKKGKEADLLVDELLEKLGLTEYANLRWKEISTGYRLRFQLAKMLLTNPDLLVLDEPIANLDINGQGKFLSDLKNIVSEKKRNVSAILSSQQLHEIENVSDSIVFLKKGAMIYSGEVSKIGEKRADNEFEIHTSLEEDTLKTINGITSITKIGKTFHVKISLDISPEQFLQEVIKKGGKVLYFRDISSSTRRLFNN